MKVDAFLRAEEGILAALRDFLGKLLQEGFVDYLLVPQEISHGRTVLQTLVKDPAHLDKADPFSPVMPMNSATLVAQLTADKPGKKLGVLLEPCEIRALIELVKLGQASIDNLLIIGIDCLGMYEVEEYAKHIEELEGPAEEKKVDHETLATSREGVFAAGDAVLGGISEDFVSCVQEKDKGNFFDVLVDQLTMHRGDSSRSAVRAIAAGRKAAESIDKYLGGDGVIDEPLLPPEEPNHQLGHVEGFADLGRLPASYQPPPPQFAGLSKAESPLSQEAAMAEAGRCLT